jgi:hypothetical protein
MQIYFPKSHNIRILASKSETDSLQYGTVRWRFVGFREGVLSHYVFQFVPKNATSYVQDAIF